MLNRGIPLGLFCRGRIFGAWRSAKGPRQRPLQINPLRVFEVLAGCFVSRPAPENAVGRLALRAPWHRATIAGTRIALVLAALLVRRHAADLAGEFSREIRPLVQNYCLGCHSTEKHKGDLDLERFGTMADVLKTPKPWQQAIEQLSLGEMPPKGKPSPTPAEREQLFRWINESLDQAALAREGDPGPVPLRRLNNAEYTYTLRDLTGVVSLDPAKEFPADSAAGEGFMNTGGSLVMSPALLSKYLDAGKEIASHAVLVSDGFRFSSKTSRRDWTEELVTEIREFYRRFTDARGAEKVNLQGIVFDTNAGGRLPVEAYLRATLEWRALIEQAQKSSRQGGPVGEESTARGAAVGASVARGLHAFAVERGLSGKYLESLWELLHREDGSLVVDAIRASWRQAQPEDAAELATAVGRWQKALWKFSSVGHIGKLNGPKAWMEPVSPLAETQEFRLKLVAPTNDPIIRVFLQARDGGDGNTNDVVLWQRPRLVVPGRPDLLLRDTRKFIEEALDRRERVFAAVARCLEIAASAAASTNEIDLVKLAGQHNADADALAAWFGYLGIGGGTAARLDYFTNRIASASGYTFIQGWGSADTPSIMANASDQEVRIPGKMKPHAVAVHPSPKLNVGIGWRSPGTAVVRLEGAVTHAHPECGNGVEWTLELRRGQTRQVLAKGVAQGGQPVRFRASNDVGVQNGDLISVLVGARDGNHSCDLTDIEWTIQEVREGGQRWALADVSRDLPAANPHPDNDGREGIWHFYTEAVSGTGAGAIIPAGSLLARWQCAANPQSRGALASAIGDLLKTPPPATEQSADAALYRQLASLSGPLFAHSVRGDVKLSEARKQARNAARSTDDQETAWGMDPSDFGKDPEGKASVDDADLCVRAPAVSEIRLPADLVSGAELVVTGCLHPQSGREGSVQLQVARVKPTESAGLVAGVTEVNRMGGMWTSDDRRISHSSPILVKPGSSAQARLEAGFDVFRRWFPAALCYEKIVPVDEVITLTLFHREDEPLCRLMLGDAETARLNKLWDDLRYISRDAITLVDAFEQLWQYATQDADPKVFEPLRQPIRDRAAALQKRLVDTQPEHLRALLEFAGQAYRRPLTDRETKELRDLYHRLRSEEIPHDEAFRLTLARIFVAPSFLYRLESAPQGKEARPVSDAELATRLSYFLWSSMPDAELRNLAEARRLHEPDVLAAQAKRMMSDGRTRRWAVEFGSAWLHLYDFKDLNEKSERHFPTFGEMRDPMFEEVIQYLTDFAQHDGSILTLFDSDHSFLNESLAKYYGVPDVSGATWRRVDGVKKLGRGGVLGFGATLAKQSGASRTSPILRGNWVAEVLLGDKLPRPPKDVPRLPEDEATETLTVRQLVEKHSSDPRCASCHQRIDGFGFALEGYDAIGRVRTKDLADRPIDARSQVFDGTAVNGASGLREYLLTKKRDVVVQQFCRKLLGYALGRSVILSDKPLLAEMQNALRANDYRISVAVDAIVRSRQFREIRGADLADEG